MQGSSGRCPRAAQAVIDADVEGPAIVVAEAEVGRTIAGEESAEQRPIGSHDADAAGARCKEIPVGIALETVDAAALDLLRVTPKPYDLLIADLKMPGMDGLTLIRQVKQIRSGLPIIIITGFSTESSAIEAVNLGVSGYLTKPFRVPRVLAVAAKALGE